MQRGYAAVLCECPGRAGAGGCGARRVRAHPPAPGQAAVRDAAAVHEALLPHRLHGPRPVRGGAEAVQHHPPAQRDGVGGGPAVPLVPRQLAGRAAHPRGAAGEAPVLEVHPGAVPALRRPGQGVQQVPADGRGGSGGRPGEAAPQRGRREPEEGRAPQGTAGQLPQGHADALRGTLSVGVHLTSQKTPRSTPSPCSGAWNAASALPPQQSLLGGWSPRKVQRGAKCHPPPPPRPPPVVGVPPGPWDCAWPRGWLHPKCWAPSAGVQDWGGSAAAPRGQAAAGGHRHTTHAALPCPPRGRARRPPCVFTPQLSLNTS